MNRNTKVLITFSVIGVIVSSYMLYERRGGCFAINDFITLSIVILLVVLLSVFFNKKWNN
jgi:hypothetical protein